MIFPHSCACLLSFGRFASAFLSTAIFLVETGFADITRIAIQQGISMLEGPKSGMMGPRLFSILVRHTSNNDGVLVLDDERGGGVEQIKGVSELAVFCAALLLMLNAG